MATNRLGQGNMQIIVKNYEHFNKSLPNWNSPKGVYVKSKDHYDKLCKEAGMVSVDKFGETGSRSRKDYVLSEKAQAIITAASQTKDKKGKVKLGDKAVKAMIDMGAIKPKADWNSYLPSNYQKAGGFA